MTTLIVIAKECLPGKAKTRLHPPYSLEQAARIAHASVLDTLHAVSGLAATRRILYFDGDRPPAEAADYEVIQQVAGSLDQRLGDVFDQCEGPTVLVGMDTPQLTTTHLAPLFDEWPNDTDASIGPAEDGGFWTLGLAEPDGDLIRGVPMSRDDTGMLQHQRLLEAGLRTTVLPMLRDIDTADDLDAVAQQIPSSRIAELLRTISVEEVAR